MIVIGILLLVILIFILVGYVFMRQPQFGKKPSGPRLERMKRSAHYQDGQFHNLSNTPALTEGASYYAVIKEFFFGSNKRKIPGAALPSVKVDLYDLDPSEDVLVWFGHSSYFMQLSGLKILVDPVLSGHASPVAFTTKSFKGADVYNVDDIPAIDYLFISHDHWDHLDYKTVTKLKPKIGRIITGLGVGAHLEHWGFDKNIIIECDWNETIELEDRLLIHTAPARHFSGRGFKRNGTLWLSFILQAPGMTIYIGGDSGFDHHFETIGKQYGPFDLAILENGQYDPSWKYIHMMPEEVVAAAIALKAQKFLPVHWSKFALANHSWDDPIIRVLTESRKRDIQLLHPMLGELVYLKKVEQQTKWWEQVR